MTRNANYIKNLSIYHKEGFSTFLNVLLIDPDEHCSLWQVVDLDTNNVHTFDIHRIVVDITSIPEFKNHYPSKSSQTRMECHLPTNNVHCHDIHDILEKVFILD